MRRPAAILGFGLVLAISSAAAIDYSAGQRALRRGDLQGAYDAFKEAAEGGDVEAARRLGFILGRGLEIQGGQKIEARPEEAAKWHRVAADRGDAVSADVLGAMLAVGRGVPVDPDESLRRFKQAGRDIRQFESAVERYPEGDRAGVMAWFLAMRSVMDREAKRLRSVGAPGEVLVVFRAEPPHVEVSPGADAKLTEYVGKYTREILDLAPPPPAARHAHAAAEFRFVFE